MKSENLPIGKHVIIDGVEMVHVGGGQFRPVESALFKRFSEEDGEPVYMGNR